MKADASLTDTYRNAPESLLKPIHERQRMLTDLHPSQLEPGDILLCRGNVGGVSPTAYIRSQIAEATSSPYTHAALYLGTGKIVDARVLQGIKVRPLIELIADSDYVAAVRQPDVWSNDRIARLRQFAERLDAMGMKYNTDAFKGYVLEPVLNRKLKWEQHKQDHRVTVMDQIEALFSGATSATPEDPYRKYFCSELVVAAYQVVGYLGPGADKIYQPAYTAPGDIVRDCTFGFLVGYLAKGSPRSIPEDDPLVATPLVTTVPPWGI